jgi:hypothetical protein
VKVSDARSPGFFRYSVVGMTSKAMLWETGSRFVHCTVSPVWMRSIWPGTLRLAEPSTNVKPTTTSEIVTPGGPAAGAAGAAEDGPAGSTTVAAVRAAAASAPTRHRLLIGGTGRGAARPPAGC